MRPAIVLAAALLLAGPASAQTIGEIQLKAMAGDRESQFVIGEAYRTGQGVTPDREQAIAWFRKGAAQGDLRAADALGLLLFTKGERRESVPLLEAAARREDARALYLLGVARFNGDGVPKDMPRAYAQMRAAANKGLPQAIRSLQIMEPYVTAQDRAAADRIASGAQPVILATLPPPPSPAPVAMPATALQPPVHTFEPVVTQPLSALPSAPAPMRTIELPPSAPAITATVPSPPPRPAAPRPVTPPPVGKWRAQLGALTSQSKAEEQWRFLTRRIPQLAGQPHVIVQAGLVWRLQATGLPSKAEAQRLCGSVEAKSSPCIVLAPAS